MKIYKNRKFKYKYKIIKKISGKKNMKKSLVLGLF